MTGVLIERKFGDELHTKTEHHVKLKAEMGAMQEKLRNTTVCLIAN